MSSRVAPPALALWLLERLLPRSAAEAVTGDLIEEFTGRASVRGVGHARRWFWRQTAASLASRWRTAAGPHVGAGLARGTAHAHAKTGTTGGLMRGWTIDFRFALRSLARSPGFCLTAVATLAIGVAGATTIATAAGWAWLRPLPFAEPDRLVHVGEGSDTGAVGNVGFETLLDWQARASSFERIVPVRAWTATLVGETGAARLVGLRVGAGYFRMLGVEPALGRDFTIEDDTPDRWRVVMLSHGLWSQRFGADPAIVGRFIELGGRDYEVIGVMPAAFEPLISERYYGRADLWAPLGYAAGDSSACRTCRHIRAFGRLARGATVAGATAELAGIQDDLRADHPADYGDAPPAMLPLSDEISGDLQRPLQVLMAAVGFLLFVACANVAGLLIARSAGRQHEIGVRAALGASRLRIARQLLVESLLLAAAATSLGVGLSKLGLLALVDVAPDAMQRLDRASSDPAVWLVAAGVGTLALVAFGVVPALEGSRAHALTALRAGRHSAGARAVWLREAMIVGQVAVALVLLVAGGLMFRTVHQLLSVDPGFNPRGVLTAQFSLVGARWAEDEAVYAFQQDIVDRVRALPGVEAAGLTGLLPLGGSYDRRGFGIEGQRYLTPDEVPSAERYAVTPGYFEAMQIVPRRGRLFEDGDTAASSRVALVSETAVRTFWRDENPLGQRIKFGTSADAPWVTVVGVVGDVRHYDLETPPIPQVYLPQSQSTDSYLTLVVRAPETLDGLAAGIRQSIAALASDVPMYSVARFDELQSAAVGARLFMMQLLGVFAAASVLLAAVGLYGVVSQAVQGRLREIGIRVSLGARQSAIATLILRRGALVLGAGVVLGLLLAIASSGFLEAQLFRVAAVDPVTYIVSAAAVLAAGLAAHALPLRRALRVDPSVELRGS